MDLTPHDSHMSLSNIVRKQREQSIQGIKDVIQQIKYDEMLEIKRQSVVIRIKKQEQEEQIIQEKQKKILEVKEKEFLASLKKQAFFQDKLEKIKRRQHEDLNE